MNPPSPRVAPLLAVLGTLSLALPFVVATPTDALACTAFGLPGTTTLSKDAGAGPIVAKSYDWANGDGAVHTNRRGVRRTGMTGSKRDRVAKWISQYSSVTFNQYGRDMPNGGMNEKGLVVEVLWLTESRFPDRDARPALNELQWVQYQLDNFATLAEVAVAAPFLRISNLYAPVHYFVCDASGTCGTFEFLNGSLVMHVGKTLPLPVLTNNTYAQSQAIAAKYKGIGAAGSKASLPTGGSSLARFTRAASQVQAHRGTGMKVKAAFATLDDVAQHNDYTKWQIVYEPKALNVHFRTNTKRAVKTIKVPTGDAGHCRHPVKVADMAATQGGNLRLKTYDAKKNSALVSRSFGKLGLVALALAPLVSKVKAMPGQSYCTLPAANAKTCSRGNDCPYPLGCHKGKCGPPTQQSECQSDAHFSGGRCDQGPM